jgi:MmyB-like transcription regulator ligand binding domain
MAGPYHSPRMAQSPQDVVNRSLGAITLDSDTLHVPDVDQAVVVYSAPPDTPESEALALLRVVGTQQWPSAPRGAGQGR